MQIKRLLWQRTSLQFDGVVISGTKNCLMYEVSNKNIRAFITLLFCKISFHSPSLHHIRRHVQFPILKGFIIIDVINNNYSILSKYTVIKNLLNEPIWSYNSSFSEIYQKFKFCKIIDQLLKKNKNTNISSIIRTKLPSISIEN